MIKKLDFGRQVKTMNLAAEDEGDDAGVGLRHDVVRHGAGRAVVPPALQVLLRRLAHLQDIKRVSSTAPFWNVAQHQPFNTGSSGIPPPACLPVGSEWQNAYNTASARVTGQVQSK